MKHHTTDPAKRAEHIATRIEQEHESLLRQKGENPYKDWHNFWLNQYKTILSQLVENTVIKTPES